MAEQDDKVTPGQGAPGNPKGEDGHRQAPAVAPGSYESVCPDCAGDGRLKDGQTCPTCDGTGWTTPLGH